MNERDKLIKMLIEEKGGSRADYLRLLNKIAYHESGGTMNPMQLQLSGGPGRGKYQFEIGKDKGGITAARRVRKYYERNDIPVPQWLDKATSNNSLDATTLSPEQQDILFLGNMREHPKADFGKVWSGEMSDADFWANYHWAGNEKDRLARMRSFSKSETAFKDSDYAKVQNPWDSYVDNLVSEASIPTQSSKVPAGFQNVEENRLPTTPPKTSTKQRITPVVDETSKLFTEDFAMGGNMIKDHFRTRKLNAYNNGGLHETNPNGGIPQGTGSNGKPNTVEEGESSYDFKDGKFIFSNRIDTKGNIFDYLKSKNKMAMGGPTDPPTESEKNDIAGRDFAANWFANPETRKRYAANLGISREEADAQLNEAIIKMSTPKINFMSPRPNVYGESFDGMINYYGPTSKKTGLHERVHESGVDRPLSEYIKDNLGASPYEGIREKTGASSTKDAIIKEWDLDPTLQGLDSRREYRGQKKHMDEQIYPGGEIYSRVMEIRQELGLKPGDVVTEDMLENIYNKEFNELTRYWSKKKMTDVLNTVAMNNNLDKYKGLV